MENDSCVWHRILILLAWQKVQLLCRQLSNSLFFKRPTLSLIQSVLEAEDHQWGWRLTSRLSLLRLQARFENNLQPGCHHADCYISRWFCTGSMQWFMGWQLLVPASTFAPASRSSPIQPRFLPTVISHPTIRLSYSSPSNQGFRLSNFPLLLLLIHSFKRLWFTSQIWASVTLGQSYNSKSFLGEYFPQESSAEN